tara:strand:+ start:16729 stop:16935 length:207 start_codon:yes stop_codon:yes gene_type:complete
MRSEIIAVNYDDTNVYLLQIIKKQSIMKRIESKKIENLECVKGGMRKGRAKKRPVAPDPRYGDELLSN